MIRIAADPCSDRRHDRLEVAAVLGHTELIAKAIDRAWSQRWAALDTHSGQRQLQLDMGAVIDALADTFENLPGFDRAQFVEACEGGVW